MSSHAKRKALVEAEKKAAELFTVIEKRKVIQPGKTEVQINRQIFDIAEELFGIQQYWHKRIVRAGKNTLLPYKDNPPNLMVQEDDILFLDFGPVFEEWEADLGRTYVLGEDPDKLKLKQDIEEAWHEGKAWFDAQEDVTCEALYKYCQEMAEKRGWEYGGPIAGHLIGHFPHQMIYGKDRENYIMPGNDRLMKTPFQDQELPPNWILEIHFVDREKEIGGFFEQLLT